MNIISATVVVSLLNIIKFHEKQSPKQSEKEINLGNKVEDKIKIRTLFS